MITLDTLRRFLQHLNVLACSDDFMTPAEKARRIELIDEAHSLALDVGLEQEFSAIWENYAEPMLVDQITFLMNRTPDARLRTFLYNITINYPLRDDDYAG